MNANLLSLVQGLVGSDLQKSVGQFLGEPQAATQSALSSVLPVILGSVATKGATPEGAAGLMRLIDGANLDTSVLGNLGGLFGNGDTGANGLLKLGTSLVPALFGDKSNALASALAGASGIRGSSATNLIGMLVPLVLAFLKKFIGDKGLNAGSLSALLSSQGPNLKFALDGRLTSALGFGSPAGMIEGLGSQTVDVARRGAAATAGAATAVARETKSGLMRWLPWLIALAILLLLWQYFFGRPRVAPPPAPSAPAASAPAPVVATLPTKVYFEVGAANIGAAGSDAIRAVAALALKDGIKLDVTGYTDRTGDEASNVELSKQRAQAVRDALMAAGVAESNIGMKPPIFVTGTGSDAEARRVEISRQ